MRRRQTFAFKPFAERQPIDRIQILPLAFVISLLVIIFHMPSVSERSLLPEVELPILRAEPTGRLHPQYVVTISAPLHSGQTSSSSDNDIGARTGCRVFVGNGVPVDSRALYDHAFASLDNIITRVPRSRSFPAGAPDEIIQRKFHIRADAKVPWHCVAGPIHILERAGASEIGFLATPVV